MKNFRFRFVPQGLVLFVLVMLPNLLWFAVPAPNDALRAASVTPGLDAAASVCQALLVAALVFVQHAAGPFPRKKALLWGAGAALAGYYAAWGCYYLGLAGPPVILALAFCPASPLASLRWTAKIGRPWPRRPLLPFSTCQAAS